MPLLSSFFCVVLLFFLGGWGVEGVFVGEIAVFLVRAARCVMRRSEADADGYPVADLQYACRQLDVRTDCP